MKQSKPTEIELLAPARDAEVARAAIDHGADAIYIGPPSHGARAAAANSLGELASLCDYAHRFGVRIYATVNTLIYDAELEDVRSMVADLYAAGVDALIVQDMGLLMMDIPPIDLHASTQCDIRTVARARFAAEAGFSRIVLPREFSVDDIALLHAALPSVEIEAFVHGALCVSYSGACRAGFATAGRSANRGECPQLCRLPYDLLDSRGRLLVGGKHLLSLRDLNRSASLRAMIMAGVTSFKIEGRLKDANYVRNVVASYRRDLDAIIADDPALCRRSSFGATGQLGFTPDVAESFNRGFTDYFTRGRAAAGPMASLDSPKWTGREVATVVAPSRRRGEPVRISSRAEIANGDGLGFFDPASGEFVGFRVNRAEPGRIYLPADAPRLTPGMRLMRNRNKLFDDALAASSPRRSIALDITLRLTTGGDIAIEGSDERGCRATAVFRPDEPLRPARTPQLEPRERTLRKTGDTIYAVGSVSDLCGDLFIPVSRLAELRRELLALLDRSWAMRRPVRLRRPLSREAMPRVPQEMATLTDADNVANRLAREFYTLCGADVAGSAIEVEPGLSRDDLRSCRVMTTRYCIRRELGECLREHPGGRRLPAGDLFLRSGSTRFRVGFDCARCGMDLFLD